MYTEGQMLAQSFSVAKAVAEVCGTTVDEVISNLDEVVSTQDKFAVDTAREANRLEQQVWEHLQTALRLAKAKQEHGLEVVARLRQEADTATGQVNRLGSIVDILETAISEDDIFDNEESE